MHTFRIGDTNFGVDTDASSVEVLPNKDGKFDLYIEVAGQQDIFDALCEGEDSAWSWALYPPFLFIRGVPLSRELAEVSAPIQVPEWHDTLEMGLYMMAYSTISEVTIQLGSFNEVVVRGCVDFWGEKRSFEVRMPYETQREA
jgi:hypothetical protein